MGVIKLPYVQLTTCWHFSDLSKQKQLWKTCDWHRAIPAHYTDMVTPSRCAILLAHTAPNQYFNMQRHPQLISGPFNPFCTLSAGSVLWQAEGGTVSVNYTPTVILIRQVS